MEMKASLKSKLLNYIVEHNPELLLQLQENFTVSQYINDRVLQVMDNVQQWLSVGISLNQAEDMALRSMTVDLRPSRYLYLKNVLEEEFKCEAEAFIEAGVLTYELVNLIGHCTETFAAFQFCEENQGSRKLRHAIIADIAAYIN